LMMTFFSYDLLQSSFYWLWGSFGNATYGRVALVGIVLTMSTVYLFMNAHVLDALLLHDDVATNLGVELPHVRVRFLVVATLITSLAVAFCGIIGFIGLVVPGVLRQLVQNNHRLLIPLVMLTGGVTMSVCDLLARTVGGAVEIPVGIITIFLGAPIFLGIMIKWRTRCHV